MKKKLFSTILVCALLLLIAVGCNNSPKSKPTPTPQPEEDVTRPATLRVGYFRESYVKGAAKPEGTLYYTDTAGRASSVSIQSADVTTDFDGNTVGENKTLKITYKGIDAIAQYTVVEPEKIDINGVYIVGENSILIFTTDADGKLTIDKEVWKNWKVYSNFDLGDPTNVTTTEGLEYKIDVTSSGATVIRADNWAYRPDGKGGIQSYKSEDDFLDPANGYIPSLDYFYVSSTTAGRGTDAEIKNKYLVIAFSDGISDYQNMYMWFVDDTAPATIATLTKANASIVVDSAKFAFGQAGVELPKTAGLAAEGKKYSKNLKVYSREGYTVAKGAFSIVSYSDETYNGYSYSMGLSTVAIPGGFWD